MEIPERGEMRIIDAVLVFVNEEEHREGPGAVISPSLRTVFSMSAFLEGLARWASRRNVLRIAPDPRLLDSLDAKLGRSEGQ